MTESSTDRRLLVAVERVRLVNYRSIEKCDVRLGPLTYLVGPNGAGKSNFLDALRLVSDALTTSLDQAVRERGGFYEICRRGSRSKRVSIEIELRLPQGSASYAITLEPTERSGFRVLAEGARLGRPSDPNGSGFSIRDGKLDSSEPALPLPPSNRLYLVTAANLLSFGRIFDALSRMAFYNLDPAAMRDPQPPDLGELLTRNGGNAASVPDRLGHDAAETKRVVEEYLSIVVPGVVGVRPETVGSREGLRFEQESAPGEGINPRFPAQSMSDGTLRALGVLLALFQSGPAGRRPSLVGIEEPETAVHPAAAAVLRDAIVEASRSTQVLVTTHSPELLDDPDLDPDALLAVESIRGRTVISRPDPAGLSAVRDGLYTAGELLRVGQLRPDSGS